jgi:hypothetical protein
MAPKKPETTAIIEHLQPFLLELGKGFAFVARQYRVATESQHFFIDLVFYNYLLKCFVLIYLKIGRLEHNLGKLDLYLEGWTWMCASRTNSHLSACCSAPAKTTR